MEVGDFCIKSLALLFSGATLFDVCVIDALLFASKLLNEKIDVALVAVPAFDPNKIPLFESVSVIAFAISIAIPPSVASVDWSQHLHLGLESSFWLKHAKHPQKPFCSLTIGLNTLSVANDVLDVALDVVGNRTKLNVGFGDSVLFLVVAVLAALRFDPAQETHILCA